MQHRELEPIIICSTDDPGTQVSAPVVLWFLIFYELLNGLVVSEKNKFEFLNQNNLGQGQGMTLTSNSHITPFTYLGYCLYQIFILSYFFFFS